MWLEPDEFLAWRRRLGLECRGRNLTETQRICLEGLQAALASGHRVTDAYVAEQVGHSERTVRRARVAAQRLGLLTWQHTRREIGGRWRQGPNAYTLHVPARPICPGGQAGRPKKEKEERQAPRSVRMQLLLLGPEAVCNRDPLAERRAVMEGRPPIPF
jgi:hypothetical protein